MMKKTCLVVRGKKQNDERFRPGSMTPDMHWAYLLLGFCAEHNEQSHTMTYPKGVSINWDSDQDDVISIRLTSDLWKNDEQCFEHLMGFIKQNDLTYEFPCNMEECGKCEGHPACISNDHAEPVIRASELLKLKKIRAA